MTVKRKCIDLGVSTFAATNQLWSCCPLVEWVRSLAQGHIDIIRPRPLISPSAQGLFKSFSLRGAQALHFILCAHLFDIYRG